MRDDQRVPIFPLTIPFLILGVVLLGYALVEPGEQLYHVLMGTVLVAFGGLYLWATTRHL